MASATQPDLPKVIIELDRTNYLLWKSHLLPIFNGSDLMGMINGTITEDSNPTINLAFLEWKKKDQLFSRAFTSQTNARYYQIKHDLSTIRKGSKSVTEYMDRIRLLTYELLLFNNQ
ncbi:hypothetical protein Ddye_025973 [Dipteronia dyeriana]|uniref:Retrotransposon Copia-like N-terminal domain-containing protein n=1 Tax=Dipteronia dyeriana TaxID=168575 RepID=A0AAD9WQ16_9ROSI|nr:hypothetical protein Ddye_025973 [Dipteronia dyeriana]